MPPRRRAKPRSPAHAALGQALEELRHEAGLTQEGLAERVGTEFNRIGELERGTTDARFSTLLRVAGRHVGGLHHLGRRVERTRREESS
ncbi:MAG: helix-turn-helix transcriptional regulator [Solirubrobacterales bacterium]